MTRATIFVALVVSTLGGAGGVARAEAPALGALGALAGSPAALAALAVSPAALDFAGPGARAVTVRNRGAAPLTLERITLAPDSSGFVVDESAPRTLQPGEELALHVQFVPDGRRQQAFAGLLRYRYGSVRGVPLRPRA